MEGRSRPGALDCSPRDSKLGGSTDWNNFLQKGSSCVVGLEKKDKRLTNRVG